MKSEGAVRCGGAVRPGLAEPDSSAPAGGSAWRGLNVEICRAIAVAVLGPGGRFEFHGYATPRDYDAVRGGADEVLFLTASDIGNVVHRGLRRFIQRDDPSGLPAAYLEKFRNILSFLQDMEDAEELRGIPNWKAHQLTADRIGTWSLSIARNWRITFRIGEAEGEILDLDYEDYH